MSTEMTFGTVEEAVQKLDLSKGNYKSFCGYLYRWTKNPRHETVFFNGEMIRILFQKTFRDRR
jgi:hypothetical protein